MTSLKPLYGIELLDCAQANAKSGLTTAVKQCGYGTNITAFQNELQKASREIGIHINNLDDLILEIEKLDRGRDFAPDSSGRI